MLELDIIWGAFLREIERANFSNVEEVENVIEVIDFAMLKLCICDETSSMSQVHLLVNFTMRKLFEEGKEQIPSSTVAALIRMCHKVEERLNFPKFEVQKNILTNEADSVALEKANNLLIGPNFKMGPDDLALVIISNITMISRHSKRLINFSPNDTPFKIDTFIKASAFLQMFYSKGISMHNMKIDGGLDLWLDQLLSELKISKDAHVISACLNKISEFSSIWGEKHSQLCEILIDSTLPLLWAYFGDAIHDKGYICLLITTLCRILPNESDIFFAKVLSSAIRSRKFEVIELFTNFWEFSVTSQLLTNVPLRISVLILVDSMTKNEFKFRKCSYSWIFSISKYLDRFLVPALSSFIDILECGLNEASNSALSAKKSFRKNFDKDPLIYYLNIFERILDVNYESVHNYLSVTEIDSYLMIQLSAFVDLVKRHLNIDFEFNYSKILLFALVHFIFF